MLYVMLDTHGNAGAGVQPRAAEGSAQLLQHAPLVSVPSPALMRQEAEGGLLLIQGLVRSCQGALPAPAHASCITLRQGLAGGIDAAEECMISTFRRGMHPRDRARQAPASSHGRAAWGSLLHVKGAASFGRPSSATRLMHMCSQGQGSKLGRLGHGCCPLGAKCSQLQPCHEPPTLAASWPGKRCAQCWHHLSIMTLMQTSG